MAQERVAPDIDPEDLAATRAEVKRVQRWARLTSQRLARWEAQLEEAGIGLEKDKRPRPAGEGAE